MKETHKRFSALCCVLLVACVIVIPFYRAHLATEAEGLVQQLSWHSVGGDCIATCLVVFPDGPAAKRLVSIGTPASKALLRALDDPSRGVPAHLILTQIYHPDRAHAFTEDHRHETRLDPTWGVLELTGVSFTVNGLRWDWHVYGDRNTVDPDDLKRISQLWHAEL